VKSITAGSAIQRRTESRSDIFNGRSITSWFFARAVILLLVIGSTLPHDEPMRDPRDDMEDRRDDIPAGLYFSRRGNWFHDGDRVFHVGLSSLLNRSVSRSADGALIVTTGHDVLPFVAEDAPLVVRSVERAATALQLRLSTGEVEHLAGDLYRGDDERVRVVVGNGRFWGLLSRSAAQSLEPLLNDDGDVVFGTQRHRMVMLSGVDWSATPAPPAT
jgi:hypothetical protein